MDGQTLQQLFAGPNPFLAQMGEKAFNLDQQKRQADLASLMGQEDRARQMLPAELAGKTAVTRLNNSTAAMNEDTLAANIPAAQRQKQKLQESLSKMDEVSRAQMKAQVTRSAQIANAIKKNNGQIPEWLTLSPEERPYYTPDKLDAHLAFGQAFMEMDPEEISKRRRAAEAERLAKLRAEGQIAVKETPAPGKGGGSPPTVPQTYAEILAGMAKMKKASERLAYLKSVLPAVPPELAEQLRPAYNGLRVQAEAEANARTAGQVDIAATTKGKVPVTPPVSLGEAPTAVTSRPARQQATQTSQPTQADLEFTAKKYNMTVEQVKKQLGIK